MESFAGIMTFFRRARLEPNGISECRRALCGKSQVLTNPAVFGDIDEVRLLERNG